MNDSFVLRILGSKWGLIAPLTFAWTGLIVIMLVALWDDQDKIRYRNYLVFASEQARPDVDPTAWRDAVQRVAAPLPSKIEQIASEHLKSAQTDEDKALQIVGFLRRQPMRSGAIKSTTLEALDQITNRGTGYCADYTQVFLGLSRAVQLTAREWGMSFDNFSGDGHAFNEYFDHRLDKWVMIDPMNAFLFVSSETMTPMSTAEVANLLRAKRGEDLRIREIGTHFNFKSHQAAIDYYGSGVGGLFLWEPNDVFAYDQSVEARVLGPVSKSLEQMAAILTGQFPQANVLLSPENTNNVERLTNFGRWISSLLVVILIVSMLVALEVVRVLRRQFGGRAAS